MKATLKDKLKEVLLKNNIYLDSKVLETLSETSEQYFRQNTTTFKDEMHVSFDFLNQDREGVNQYVIGRIKSKYFDNIPDKYFNFKIYDPSKDTFKEEIIQAEILQQHDKVDYLKQLFSKLSYSREILFKSSLKIVE